MPLEIKYKPLVAADLLSLTGLQVNGRQRHYPRGKHFLGEFDVDEGTGGVVSIYSEPQFDSEGRLRSMEIKYWWAKPQGRSRLENLAELKVGYPKTEDPDAPLHSAEVNVEKLSIMGRQITGEGNIRTTLQAIGHIHSDIRSQNFPNIHKIFKQNLVSEAVGEGVYINGFDDEGFNFVAPPAHQTFNEPLRPFPEKVLKTFDRRINNTIDRDRGLNGNGHDRAVGVFPDNRGTYRTEVNFKDVRHKEEKIEIDSRIVPMQTVLDSMSEEDIKDIFKIGWKRDRDEETVKNFLLSKLRFFGTTIEQTENPLESMRIIGWINSALKAIAKGNVPEYMEDFARYDLFDHIFPLNITHSLEDGGELVLLSLAGNGEKKEVRDFGDQLGQCKLIMHAGLDKDGKRKIFGVCQDVAWLLPDAHSDHDGALPDLLPWLDYIDHFTITHRHLDHLDGLVAYIAHGHFRDKHVYCTPKVAKMLKKKLGEHEKMLPENMPHMHTLEDEGSFDLVDGDQKIRMEFIANGIPHSTETTGFRYIVGSNDKWIGSTRVHSDARGTRHLSGADNIKAQEIFERYKAWCQRGLRGVGIDRNDTYVEYDSTSLRNKGYAPTEQECEKNLNTIANKWFKDKGVIYSKISTNDHHSVTMVRMAVDGGRNCSFYGANEEITKTLHNTEGISPQYLPHLPREADGWNDYIFMYANMESYRRISEKIEHLLLTTESDDRREAAFELIRDIGEIWDETMEFYHPDSVDPEDYETTEPSEFPLKHGFIKPLQGYCNRLLETKSGKYTNLKHHILSEIMDDENEKNILSLIELKGRTSKFAKKHIFNGAPANKRIVGVTGTQGTPIEKESALSKLAENRGKLRADPKKDPNAIRVDPKTDMVIITQTAIPGNRAYRAELVRKLTEGQNYTVAEAVTNGVRIHNIKTRARFQEILNDLKESGKGYTASNSKEGYEVGKREVLPKYITIHDMPIHAPGHGHQLDNRDQMAIDQPDLVNVTHTNDPDCKINLYENADSLDIRHSDRVAENFEGISVRMGDTADKTLIKSIGHTAASFILMKLIRKIGQYWGGRYQSERIITPPKKHNTQSYLMAGSRSDENGVYHSQVPFTDIGTENRIHENRPMEFSEISPSFIKTLRGTADLPRVNGQKFPVFAQPN